MFCLLSRSTVLNIYKKSFPFTHRFMSTQTQMTDLIVDEEKGYATLVLKNHAGNALASSMMDEMSKAISEVEKSTCRGLVLTSGIKKIFSAGLNLMEFGGPGSSMDSVTKYYEGFQDLWIQLFKSPLITVAAMNGHSIAAGCAIGMACDYKILVNPGGSIGMNEILFGVPIPYFLLETMIALMGYQNASKSALLAKVYSPEEALKIGLVDEICSLENMDASVENIMRKYLLGNKKAQISSKLDVRHKLINFFHEIREKDLARVVSTVTDPEIQQVLHAYIASVTGKQK